MVARLCAYLCRTVSACLAAQALLVGCNSGSSSGSGPLTSSSSGGGGGAPVQVVVFTHVEDNTPVGVLGSPQSKASYDKLRSSLLAVAEKARARTITWVLQPDWTLLEAALLYEDAARRATTGGKNVFAYLRDELGVPIDPHSHEKGGYNYADVAYLLAELGVGGSTVIGGHIWDPSLPEFQEWDRFREPLKGQKYPSFSWRGDILIGAGTPNHVNDPVVSGLWRPLDRDHFFEHSPSGNIVAVGAWRDDLAGVEELVALRASGSAPTSMLLTAYWNVQPKLLTADDGPADVDASVFAPLAWLRDEGAVEVTDFAALVARWRSEFGGAEGLYRP
jgi:hypothetical protein